MENKPKGPTFEFRLPPEDNSVPVLGANGALNMPEEFNPHLTKKEFNFFMVQNLTPLIQLTYGLIGQMEKLRVEIEELKKAAESKEKDVN